MQRTRLYTSLRKKQTRKCEKIEECQILDRKRLRSIAKPKHWRPTDLLLKGRDNSSREHGRLAVTSAPVKSSNDTCGTKGAPTKYSHAYITQCNSLVRECTWRVEDKFGGSLVFLSTTAPHHRTFTSKKIPDYEVRFCR